MIASISGLRALRLVAVFGGLLFLTACASDKAADGAGGAGGAGYIIVYEYS